MKETNFDEKKVLSILRPEKAKKIMKLKVHKQRKNKKFLENSGE